MPAIVGETRVNSSSASGYSWFSLRASASRTPRAAALVGGDAAGEKAGIDAEPLGEPLDRLPRRAGLAALDLRDVLLENRSPARSVW